MINTRHKFLGIALGLTAGVALAASAEAQTPKKGGTAVLALTQDPGNLIANVSNNLPDRMVRPKDQSDPEAPSTRQGRPHRST